jgi:hypothetical protein
VFTIAPPYAGVLKAGGLDRFERVMAAVAPPDAVTRAVPGRFTTRIELPHGAGGGDRVVVYLKRYRGGLRAGAAGHEWRRLVAVRAAGLPAPEPVAFGERRCLFWPRESFLITLEIPGATQADWWIDGRPGRRRDLAAAVGRLARRFHDAGFHHQDFYLCHFFVREKGGDRAQPLDLHLIDLQRCGRLGSGGRRWLVKDLGQLHSSFRAAGLGAEDWECFLAAYGPLEPALLRAVLRKSARIARHVPKHG